MINENRMIVRQGRDHQRGQALVWVGLCIVALMFLGAIIVDLGFVYAAYQQLQASTQAAALAGADLIPTTATSSITTTVETYGVATGDLNYKPNLNNSKFPAPVMTVTYPACIKTFPTSTTTAPPCYQPTGDSTAVNAIQVTQTATVATIFAKLFGVSSLRLSSTVEAVAPGVAGTYEPYNVMMILDTTNSMGTTHDSGCTVAGVSGSPTAEQCAQAGVQTLLLNLGPCPSSLTSCGTATNYNVPTPLDEVGLMVFPGLCSAALSGENCPLAATGSVSVETATTMGPTADDDTTCSSANPAITNYNNNPIYLVYPLASDYRASDAATSLNTSSGIVIAVNGSGSKSCPGVATPGGVHTFYAGAIAAAQAYLTSTTTNPRAKTVKNVIILLSDGDANATGTVPDTNSSAESTDDMWGQATTNGALYPSTNDCAQAVTAATNAKNAGILIYSVSYGSENTGCTTDTGAYKTPCATMSAIASTPVTTYFFSVPNAGTSGGTVCSPARSETNLNQVFKAIAGDLTQARLVPPGTT